MFEQNHKQVAIELCCIKKTYNERDVLSIHSYCFEHQKRYALLGANGSGKTTLLRILAGLLVGDEGEVHYGELYRTGEIGYLPQKPYAFALPVAKSVGIGIPSYVEGRRTLALEALDRVGMRAFADMREDKLSGGEAQRVALARTMIQKRKLLLLDEPSSATDIAGTELIESALNDFCQATKCTMVFATHSPAQAIRLADVVIFLENGLIVEHGDAKTVIRSPSTECARAFLRNWQF